MNTTAGAVAQELRRIADALDKEPTLEIAPYLSISAKFDDVEGFRKLAKIMPRPMTKKIAFEGETYEDFVLESEFWNIKIPRKTICKIIQPARPAIYDCPPVLSEEEEAEMTGR